MTRYKPHTQAYLSSHRKAYLNVIHDGDVMGQPIATRGNKFQHRIRDYHPLLA